jgi:hypothetical protein
VERLRAIGRWLWGWVRAFWDTPTNPYDTYGGYGEGSSGD